MIQIIASTVAPADAEDHKQCTKFNKHDAKCDMSYQCVFPAIDKP